MLTQGKPVKKLIFSSVPTKGKPTAKGVAGDNLLLGGRLRPSP